MLPGINLTSMLNSDDEYNDQPDKECHEKHKFRVANATLEIAIDIHTDFKCDTDS